MSSAFAACAETVTELRRALLALEGAAMPLQIEPLAEREWFQLLEQKLVPQMSDSAFLVAAVCGGTNIGKSVIFNHLAGTKASAVTHLASGTKHPTCLVPANFEASHDLQSIFPGFELRAWESSDAALRESSESLLFWRSDASLPPNLLVLDTPDIDSIARENWDRADMIRRAADVLIAVLTSQKYNDAAVKEFFAKAAAEDKVVLIVFNQVHLPDQEIEWPDWLQTFCTETKIRPHVVYLTPHDRRAAEENRLPFFEREWPAEEPQSEISDLRSQIASPLTTHLGRRLNEDLSALRFGEIKLRTLGRSLGLLLEPSGVASYLDEIRIRSGEFLTAGELLSTHELANVEDWPTVPNGVLVQHIRGWWQGQRDGWSGAVHQFYNRLGSGLTTGYRFLYDKVVGTSVPPLDTYREQEWKAVLTVVDDVYDRLHWFLELGNPLLQPRLSAMLGAMSRQQLIELLKARHAACDFEADIQRLITTELDTFRSQSPQYYKSLRQIDAVAAAVRPVTSIALFVTGFGPVGHLAGDAVVASAVHLAGDVAAGGITAAVGENWIAHGASAGAAWLEARFRRIHELFAASRAAWLAELLQQHLLGTLPHELQASSQIAASEPFRQTEAAIQKLRELVPRDSFRNSPLAPFGERGRG